MQPPANARPPPDITGRRMSNIDVDRGISSPTPKEEYNFFYFSGWNVCGLSFKEIKNKQTLYRFQFSAKSRKKYQNAI